MWFIFFYYPFIPLFDDKIRTYIKPDKSISFDQIVPQQWNSEDVLI